MTFNIYSIFWTTLSLTFFLSCKGQGNINNKAERGQSTVAKNKFIELDQQIWVVFQDSKGNYWFGTKGKGVYRFNGKDLTLFTSKDGLVDNDIRGMQEDKNGNIFIETHRGISKYDGKKFSTLQAVSGSADDWQLKPDDLWFGYNADDLYRYDGSSLFELKLPRKDLKKAFGIENEGFSPYDVFGVDKDKGGNIWFGTGSAGVFRYDGKSFLWFGEKELSALPDGRVPGIRSMIQDKDGYFWLSNFYSKYKITPNSSEAYEKQKAIDLAPEIVEDKFLYFNDGLADKDGNLWMITYGGGVWKYDGERLSNFEIKNGAKEILLITIYQDKQGTLWLGTDNDGVYRQKGNGFEKFEPHQSAQ